MRRRAARMGIGCTLTGADIEKLTPADGTACLACGVPMERHTPHAPTFDRVDNREGYTLPNVAVLCHRCNMRKGDMTGAELLRLAQYVLAAEQAAQ